MNPVCYTITLCFYGVQFYLFWEVSCTVYSHMFCGTWWDGVYDDIKIIGLSQEDHNFQKSGGKDRLANGDLPGNWLLNWSLCGFLEPLVAENQRGKWWLNHFNVMWPLMCWRCTTWMEWRNQLVGELLARLLAPCRWQERTECWRRRHANETPGTTSDSTTSRNTSVGWSDVVHDWLWLLRRLLRISNVCSESPVIVSCDWSCSVILAPNVSNNWLESWHWPHLWH